MRSSVIELVVPANESQAIVLEGLNAARMYLESFCQNSLARRIVREIRGAVSSVSLAATPARRDRVANTIAAAIEIVSMREHFNSGRQLRPYVLEGLRAAQAEMRRCQ